MVSTGFSEVIGSWKIIAIRLPAHLRAAAPRPGRASPPRRRRSRPSDSGGRLGQQPQQRQRADALAAARLADDAHRLAGAQVVADAVHGMHHPIARPEGHVQVAHRQHRRPGQVLRPAPGHRPDRHRRSLGSSASRMPSPSRLKPSDAQDDGDAGEEDQVAARRSGTDTCRTASCPTRACADPAPRGPGSPRAAASTTAVASARVPCTISGLTAFGSMCRIEQVLTADPDRTSGERRNRPRAG